MGKFWYFVCWCILIDIRIQIRIFFISQSNISMCYVSSKIRKNPDNIDVKRLTSASVTAQMGAPVAVQLTICLKMIMGALTVSAAGGRPHGPGRRRF